MFDAPDIFNTFFTEDPTIAGAFEVNGINFLATFSITVSSVDKFGRVKLLVCGGLVMCLLTVNQTIAVGYCVLFFAAIFLIGFAFIAGVTSSGRSTRKSFRIALVARLQEGLTTMINNWFCTTLIGALFPVASSVSLSACFFFFFVVVIIIGTFVVYFFQIETAALTSLQIDEAYKNYKPPTPTVRSG